MTKIMLVEDDKSLREIYGVRLLAEGYDIVSAADGEEALAMAIKERPKLIISDVMMPKISGFDMLDILRSTTETKDIKVIMMTALSSEDQRQRGEQLGADRYLVKSQVGIEDVIRVVHEVLGDQAGASPAAPATPVAAPAPQPVAPAPAMNRPAVPTLPPRPATSVPVTYTPPTTPSAPPAAVYQPTAMPSTPVAAPMQPTLAPQSVPSPAAPSVKNRIIQPLNDPSTSRVDINELLDRELAKEAGIDVDSRPPVATTEQEKNIIGGQLNQFSSTTPPAAPSAPAGSDGLPTIQIDTNGRVSMPNGQPLPPTSTPPTPPAPPTPRV
jgi:CheY-like chemotaxis protein